MGIEIPQISFSNGEVSPIAAARTDQKIYANAVALASNFFVRAEGAISNRPGLQYVATCASATPLGSYLIPFIYNNQQSYLCEFSAGATSVYAGGSLVQAGIVTPFTLGDLGNLRWAQSADTLTVVVATQIPSQLKRLTASTFSFLAPQILNGPFQDLNTDGTTTVYATATQGTVTLVASKALFTAQHVGTLFTIEEQFLGSIQAWEASAVLTISGASPVGQYCRSDGKIYLCVSAPTGQSGNTYTGQFQPVHTSGTQTDGTGKQIAGDVNSVQGVSWQFVSQAAGIALITAVTNSTHATAVVQSDKGVYSNFPPTVVGPPAVVTGPFTFSGTGSLKTFTPLTAITTGDPNRFYVTVGGVFSDPTTYSINQGSTSITFFTPPPAGTNNVVVSQVTGALGVLGLPLSTYWAFGSFSTVQGYPATVVYFNDRLVYAGTQKQPQTAFTSKTANYIDFGTSTPQLGTDGIVFTVNARRENPIVDLIPLSDLLIGTASAIWRVTHSANAGAITPSDISLLPQNFYGEQAVPSVQTGDTVIYAQWGGRKIRDLIYQFQYDKFVGTELTVYARQMFPYGTTVTRMAFAPEPYGLLFCVRSDGVMAVCAYLPEQQVLAWTRYTTAGFFEDVCVLPENDLFVVYVIVRRTLNGATVRYIEKFAPRETLTIADAFFVDSGLSYDGRNTSSTTMLFTVNPIPIAIAAVVVEFGGGFTLNVQTTTAHGLSAGQTITISGVNATGTYQVNGNWTILAINSLTEFQIGTVNPLHVSGTYSSGGTILPTSVVSGNSGFLNASGTTGWASFAASDVTNNNEIWLNDANGVRLCRLQISSFLSATQVGVTAAVEVPTSVIDVPQPNWTFARTTFSGLTNIANQTASVFADGAALPQQTVSSSGTITLPSAGGVIHAGLPYICQIKSLNLNQQAQAPIRNRSKTVTRLSVIVDQSGPFFAGPDFSTLRPVEMRTFEPYGSPVAPQTGVVPIHFDAQSSDDAAICIQHQDPVPLTILGWLADLDIGEAQ